MVCLAVQFVPIISFLNCLLIRIHFNVTDHRYCRSLKSSWQFFCFVFVMKMFTRKSLFVLLVMLMVSMASDSADNGGFHLGTFMFCQVGNEVCVNFAVFFKPDQKFSMFGLHWYLVCRVSQKSLSNIQEEIVMIRFFFWRYWGYIATFKVHLYK